MRRRIMSKSNLIVLVDADVISHFIAAGELAELPNILKPHKVTILQNVYDEIARIKSRKNYLDNLVNLLKTITVIPFPLQNLDIKKEYALIKRKNPLIGEGERACMAVAKYQKDVIASSNFRDIIPYCKANKILYLGTLDILAIALKKNVFDVARCDKFISTTRKINKARYPSTVKSIVDYTPSDISFI
jgi:predicted nucleic acid-binding protein